MNASNNKLNSHKQTFLKGAIFIGLAIFCLEQPSKAFIPYIYEPSRKELEKTASSIGKTAAQLLQMGQPKEAERLAALSISLQPNDYRLWSILAEAQRANNRLHDASQSIAKAKKLKPEKASLWFAEASIALQQKKPEKAIVLLKEGLKLDPKNAIAYFQLGNARIMKVQPILALKEFKEATKIEPKFWEAINNQGLILFEIGKHKKAIKIWRQVLTIERNSEPMLALAAALNAVESGNPESIRLATEALAKNPNYVSSKHQEDQLWGEMLRKATKALLEEPALVGAVEKAIANSEISMAEDK